MMTDKRGRVRFSNLMTLGLVLIWVLLVGEFTIGSVVFGIIVAVGVQLLFPMPVIAQIARLRPLRLVWLVLVTLWGLVKASAVVSYQVLAWRRPTHNAIISVGLRSEDPFTTTLTAVLVTLVPGSVVLEMRGGRLLVHVFDTPDEAAVDAARANVLAQEAIVLGAFGTKEEFAKVRQERRDRRRERGER